MRDPNEMGVGGMPFDPENERRTKPLPPPPTPQGLSDPGPGQLQGQFVGGENSFLGKMGKMFGMAPPEDREKFLAEQQSQIDQSQADKKLVEDNHKDNLVRESFQEMQSNPATRQATIAATERMSGAQPGELQLPGEDGLSAVDKMNQLTTFLSKKAEAQSTGLTASLKADLASLDQQLSWLDKDKKDMTRQEILGVGLIAVLPALIGMMAGGKKGLMHGIAAGLSGAGKQMMGGDMTDQERVKAIIELQRVKGQKQGLLLDTEIEKGKIEGVDPLSLQKFELAQQLGVDQKDLDSLDEKQVAQVSTFGSGLQNLGYEIENPKVIAGLTQTEVPKAREALSALNNLETNLEKMLKIAEDTGGAFSIGNVITGQLYETNEAIDLNQLQADGLATVRFFQQAGANLTGVEVVLGESIMPDLTGWTSGFESDRAVKRVKNAQSLLKKQKKIMMQRYGLSQTKMTNAERAELEELETRKLEKEGNE